MPDFVLNTDEEKQLFDSAQRLHQSGQVSEAETAYRKILTINPNHSGSLHYLGVIASQCGQTSHAFDLIKRAVAIDSFDADALNSLGMLFLSERKIDLAIENLESATKATPNFLDAWVNLGGVYLESGHPEKSERASIRALDIDPNSVHALRNLATKHFLEKEYGESIKCYEKLIEIHPNDVQVLLNYAAALGIAGESLKSISIYDKVLKVDSQNIRALKDIGVTYSEIGEGEKAISFFNRILSIDKNHVDAYYALSNSKSGLSDAQVKHLANIGDNLNLPEEDQIKLNFSLAKSYEDRNEYPLAFKFYSAGNEIRQAAMAKVGIKYSRPKHESFIAEIIEKNINIDPNLIAEIDPATKDLIFVVGMPRSGTTLVDQVLASHSKIESVGESEFLDRAINKNTSNLQIISNTYLSSLKDVKAKSVVNKLPFNFLHLGLILQLYPRAKIIHCRRDGRDTALSCFFQNFTDNHPWSTDFNDIKHYYRSYQKLMEHWESQYPNMIFNLDYEEMVENFEVKCRQLFEFVNLPWEERCLTFYQNKSLVQSASKWQVRQPVHSKSVGRWQRYEPQIEQFLN
jgi:tetratricopeptide (TPR) repeat protein